MEDIKVFDEKFEVIENKQDPTEFNNIIEHINLCIQKDNENFFGLCYWFMRLKNHFTNAYDNKNMYFSAYETKNGGRFYYERIIQNYGLDERTVNRMISVAKRFLDFSCDNNFYSIKKDYYGFSRSKLFELLPLSDNQIETALKNKRLSIDSSCLQIRLYVKSLKGGEKTENKVLEEPQSIEDQLNDIQDAYNPKQHYDFEYFESKTKSQLLNIVWELQKEYEKIKQSKK